MCVCVPILNSDPEKELSMVGHGKMSEEIFQFSAAQQNHFSRKTKTPKTWGQNPNEPNKRNNLRAVASLVWASVTLVKIQVRKIWGSVLDFSKISCSQRRCFKNGRCEALKQKKVYEKVVFLEDFGRIWMS